MTIQVKILIFQEFLTIKPGKTSIFQQKSLKNPGIFKRIFTSKINKLYQVQKYIKYKIASLIMFFY